MKWLLRIATIVSIVAVPVALSVNAGQTQSTNRIVVSYSDLDLDRSMDAEILIDRIEDAASGVCWKDVDVSRLIWLRRYLRCVKKAADRAVAEVNRPVVTALYSRRHGKMAAGK